MKPWLQDNDIEMHPTHNEGNYVVSERFIGTLKGKLYRHMTSLSKNVYIDKLDNIAHKYNNTYHSTIKMKPIDIKSSRSLHEKTYFLARNVLRRWFFQKNCTGI